MSKQLILISKGEYENLLNKKEDKSKQTKHEEKVDKTGDNRFEIPLSNDKEPYQNGGEIQTRKRELGKVEGQDEKTRNNIEVNNNNENGKKQAEKYDSEISSEPKRYKKVIKRKIYDMVNKKQPKGKWIKLFSNMDQEEKQAKLVREFYYKPSNLGSFSSKSKVYKVLKGTDKSVSLHNDMIKSYNSTPHSSLNGVSPSSFKFKIGDLDHDGSPASFLNTTVSFTLHFKKYPFYL
ncbi:hypothetical protein KUTeg_010503 [Tegillarca granosa]|uniref:Uncharacterized protein n=1 Tax=Tegillarca granosa TaxID=220873 RepID=A0ABQ9F6P5_TEGGR|nr:hypothetical protein KUTeg_010503 [Tegillarca granosa]